MNTYVRAIVLLLICGWASAEEQANNSPPDWYLEEIAMLTSGSGRWETDNSKYQNENEPYETYVTEWVSSFDGQTMRGRLFGIQDGEESASFWEFRLYWHPGKDEAVMEQFGWGGTIGVGTTWQEGEGTASRQTFLSPGNPGSESGHRSSFPDANTHITESFSIVDEVWTPRRTYTWHRVPAIDN